MHPPELCKQYLKKLKIKKGKKGYYPYSKSRTGIETLGNLMCSARRLFVDHRLVYLIPIYVDIHTHYSTCDYTVITQNDIHKGASQG